MEISPTAVLAMWAAGLSFGAAIVAWWKVVGVGYTWLAGGVALALGVLAAATSGDPIAWAACAVVLVYLFVGGRSVMASGLAAAAGGLFLITTAQDTPWIAAITGAVFLGGITAEMMLGHWYLVDPRLPRWALKALVGVGLVGAVADFGMLVAYRVLAWSPGDTPVGVGFLVLTVATVVLLLAVYGALREEGYSGVMAATGLSYLALLTAIGASVVGRMLATGPVLS